MNRLQIYVYVFEAAAAAAAARKVRANMWFVRSFLGLLFFCVFVPWRDKSRISVDRVLSCVYFFAI